MSAPNETGRTVEILVRPADALSVVELEQKLAAMTDEECQHFENLLTLRAYVLGWTGDPLCQPLESVEAAYRQMLAERRATR